MEESKGNDLEPDFEGMEESKGDIEERSSNDILYQPHSATFCTCLAEFLRNVFDFLCFGSRPTIMRREVMNCNDNPRSREGSTSDQLLIMKGFDVYTQHDSAQQGRLQAPARMSFTNDKPIGSPPAEEVDGVSHHPRYRHHSISFKRPDGTPFSGNEPIRHTLLLHRSRNSGSVQSPIPILTEEALCRYDESPVTDEINEIAVDNSLKYEDVVKEANNIGLFGWLK